MKGTPILLGAVLALCLFCVLLLLGAGAPPPLLRNYVTTNAIPTIDFFDPAANALWGWDDTDNSARPIFIGANLTYDHATHTLVGGAGGSGVHVASTIAGILSSNAGPTLVTITNLPAAGITGLLTNDTTGNATTATTAINSVNSSNFWGVLSPTNLPPGLSTSNYVGTFTGNGAGLSNVVSGFITNGYTTNIPPETIDSQFSGITNLGSITVGSGITNVHLTPFGITVQSNSQILVGGGTNDNRGVGSILTGVAGTNTFHTVTTPGAIVAAYSAGQTTGSNVLNVAGTKGGIIVAQSKNATSGNLRTDITTTRGGYIMAVGDPTTSGTGATNNLSGVAVGGIMALGAGSVDNTIVSPAGAIIAIGNTGSVSYTGSNNLSAPVGSIIAINPSGTGWNHVGSTASIVALRQGTGTNIMTGASTLVVSDANGGLSVASGNSSRLLSLTTTGNSMIASGQSSFLIGDTTLYGSASVTGAGGFQWGTGYSNAFPYRAMFGYGIVPALTVSTNITVGIGTNDPQSTFHVNGTTTHGGGVTNLDLTALMFMATDANKREVSTLNALNLTNVQATNTTFLPGANVTFTTNADGTVTIAGSAGGSGVSVASTLAGVLSSNAGPTLVTITNIPGPLVTGAVPEATHATNAEFVLSPTLTNQIFSISSATNQPAWYKTISIPAYSFTPSTNTPAATNWYGANTTNGFIQSSYLFDDTAREAIWNGFAMPDDWDKGTLKFKFTFGSMTATSGNVAWYVAVGGQTNEMGAAIGITNAVHGSLSNLVTTAATAAVTPGGTLLSSDIIKIYVYRDPSIASDATGDAALVNVDMQYRLSTTPQASW